MYDIKWIRENADTFERGLERRGLEPQAGELLEVDERRRAAIAKLEAAQARRNVASKEIGQAKAGKDEAGATALMAEVAALKTSIPELEREAQRAEDELRQRLAAIPNTPLDDVPDGKDADDNVEHHRFGAKRDFDFRPEQHFELGEALGLMDFETAAKLSGARFVVLKGQLARLERALGQFMLDLHTTEHGYTEVSPPLLVRDDTMFGTAQLPKFADDQFRTTTELWLIPTAEVPLTNLVREQILEEDVFPLRLTACTPCFRAEAGAAGRDTRGMIRQHQFTKVELVSITTPEQSRDEHERMLACAEEVLRRLELHYRVVTLCTGDMGFASQKTYDIEVWLPGQGAYREISSCSICGEFQARRMSARYRTHEGRAVRHLHTLNGSGVAVGRAMIAVMENYQQADGAIAVPEVLRPYMGGLTHLGGS
ncbi:MAG: serine--tRNA ligase [Xanthobacteraceae bacterium]